MTASEIVNGLALVLMLVGALLHVLSTIGVIRFPDIYNRTHAATKSSTLGVIFVLTGAIIFFWLEAGIIHPKLVLGIVFIGLTAPVAGHVIGRAAYRSRVPLWDQSVQDDLQGQLHGEQREAPPSASRGQTDR